MDFKLKQIRVKIGRLILFSATVMTLAMCMKQKNESVSEMNFSQLQPLLQKMNDTVYVFNFWATWCKPCIKELPAFECINQEFKNKKVKIYLVSLDFPDKHKELLLPYLKNNHIRSSVIHLMETDANEWIDKVSLQWSGSIPATLVYNSDAREFYEKSLSYEDLKSIVESKM
jgi:thiol-disulfide isomerase/thioredoxin